MTIHSQDHSERKHLQDYIAYYATNPAKIHEKGDEYYEAVKKIIVDHPEVLASFGDVEVEKTGGVITRCDPALMIAVRYRNVEAARAIFDAIDSPGVASKILKQLEGEERLQSNCARGHPYYLHGEENYLPHQLIDTPAMLELFAKKGYKLNSSNSLHSVFNNLVLHLFDAGKPTKMSVKKAEALFRKGIEVGVHIRPGQYKNIADPGEDIYKFICDETAKEIANQSINETINFAGSSDSINTLARLGIDLRRVTQLTPEELKAKYKLEGLRLDIFNRAHTGLKKAGEDAVTAYEGALGSEQQRRDYVLTTCACGTFPKLLTNLRSSSELPHNFKNVGFNLIDHAIAHLDGYWKQEYRHAISAAQANLSRSAPSKKELHKTTLETYARDITFSPGKG